MGEYVNQTEIDKIQAAVNCVWPGLKICAFGLSPQNPKQVIDVEVCVPEKGNKQKIRALMELGFRKVYRELRGDPTYSPYFYLSGERAFYQWLRKDI